MIGVITPAIPLLASGGFAGDQGFTWTGVIANAATTIAAGALISRILKLLRRPPES